uniref:Uncharacterized protein n=1 Tax=Glossina brevipalpis TaxID=37001 RepID=A0A1A9W507_9MUSC
MSAATCSRLRTTATTNSNLNVVTETTVNLKLGTIRNMPCKLRTGIQKVVYVRFVVAAIIIINVAGVVVVPGDVLLS